MIGGGAAGFFGAIAAAEANPQACVQLFEAGREPLGKVLISGGGRCNVTHACFDPAQLIQHYPRGGKALRGAFTRFQPRDTVAWFAQRGVRLKTEADGRVFPTTDDAATIATCLQREAARLGVRVRTQTAVLGVTREEGGFAIHLRSGATVAADRVLLATGSSPQGYAIARQLGHRVVDPVPSLFTFAIADPVLHELAGVSVPQARLRLSTPSGDRLEQTGAVLVAHWGLSGPAVLKLSAWGARILHACSYRATLTVHWVPTLSAEEVRQALLAAKQERARRSLGSAAPVDVPRRLWLYLLHRADLNPDTRWSELSKPGLHALIVQLTACPLAIAGKGAFKEEFVTCGGVDLPEVDFRTMESRCCAGLHLAGEILDIDGVTGGFNFQSAWTTGWIAGRAMAIGI